MILSSNYVIFMQRYTGIAESAFPLVNVEELNLRSHMYNHLIKSGKTTSQFRQQDLNSSH